MSRVLVTGGSGFIGISLMARLRSAGFEAINLDLVRPPIAEHEAWWRPCDIMDASALRSEFERARPSTVVHLAARTDTLSVALDDYAVNMVGSRHIVEACLRSPHVRRLVFTSTQFVYGPFGLPQHDQDFRPHTAYGESKVQAEKFLRASEYDRCWTIIRPTNVWGPWHMRYSREFWRVLKRGLYVHPKGIEVIRSYGYVGTVVDQILAIMGAPEEQVNRQVLYVGDPAIRLIEWVNEFSLALTGRPVRQVPAVVLKGIAYAGDVVQAVSKKTPPLTSSRLRSMTETYLTPMDRTFELLGPPRYTLTQGVETTVAWLRAYVPEFSSSR
jgi:nucleoside-diphosphate-sugar epimerase